MSMHKFNPARSMLAAMLLAGIGMASIPAQAAPRFQPHEQMLMTDSLLPGGRVSVSQFRDSGSVEDAMRRLEEDWASPDLPPMRSQRDGWQVMTHMDGDVIETVEMKRSGPGIEGRRIRWKPDQKAEAALAEDERWFQGLLPATARPMPAISHVDGGHRTSTFVASTDDSVVRLDNWIGRKLQKQGYQLISDSREGGGKDAQATIYGRQGEEVVLAVSKQGNRQFAVMHWRR